MPKTCGRIYISNPNSKLWQTRLRDGRCWARFAARFLDWLKRLKVIVFDEWFKNLSFAWQLTALVILFFSVVDRFYFGSLSVPSDFLLPICDAARFDQAADHDKAAFLRSLHRAARVT